MASLNLRQHISAIPNPTNIQLRVSSSQDFEGAFLGENNARTSEHEQEFDFDKLLAEIFDCAKYDAEVPDDVNFTEPTNRAYVSPGESGGPPAPPDFEPRIDVSDLRWIHTEIRSHGVVGLRLWQYLLKQKKYAEEATRLKNALKVRVVKPQMTLSLKRIWTPPEVREPLEILPRVVDPTRASLTEIWKKSLDEKGNEDIGFEVPTESTRRGRKISKHNEEDDRPNASTAKENASGKKRARQQCPTPPLSGLLSDDQCDDFDSDDSDEEEPPTKGLRRNVHMSGIDRKSGKLTLVGTYPAEIVDQRFYCRDPVCREINNNYSAGTKNGYKYHLKNACPGNPNSSYSLRLASGIVERKGSGQSGFSQKCHDCGVTFKSEPGFRKHREENPSTKNGKCAGRRRRTDAGESAETAVPIM